jgi:hypothetical protein
LIRKTIHIIKTTPNWRNHPILNTLENQTHAQIPPPPPINEPLQPWINEIAEIGKKAQKEARTIITKHNRKSAQKAIKRFQHLINTKPKKGNKPFLITQTTHL